jgi:hypothetical protein
VRGVAVAQQVNTALLLYAGVCSTSHSTT